ncbi:unnamed protein product [Amoebophrya sp. A120]|nr:unnamed protein product [Amoebophrya sp. A120]|eukprot:GSA120T00020568001.1
MKRRRASVGNSRWGGSCMLVQKFPDAAVTVTHEKSHGKTPIGCQSYEASNVGRIEEAAPGARDVCDLLEQWKGLPLSAKISANSSASNFAARNDAVLAVAVRHTSCGTPAGVVPKGRECHQQVPHQCEPSHPLEESGSATGGISRRRSLNQSSSARHSSSRSDDSDRRLSAATDVATANRTRPRPSESGSANENGQSGSLATTMENLRKASLRQLLEYVSRCVAELMQHRKHDMHVSEATAGKRNQSWNQISLVRVLATLAELLREAASASPLPNWTNELSTYKEMLEELFQTCVESVGLWMAQYSKKKRARLCSAPNRIGGFQPVQMLALFEAMDTAGRAIPDGKGYPLAHMLYLLQKAGWVGFSALGLANSARALKKITSADTHAKTLESMCASRVTTVSSETRMKHVPVEQELWGDIRLLHAVLLHLSEENDQWRDQSNLTGKAAAFGFKILRACANPGSLESVANLHCREVVLRLLVWSVARVFRLTPFEVSGAAGPIRTTAEKRCWQVGDLDPTFTAGARAILRLAEKAASQQRIGVELGFSIVHLLRGMKATCWRSGRILMALLLENLNSKTLDSHSNSNKCSKLIEILQHCAHYGTHLDLVPEMRTLLRRALLSGGCHLSLTAVQEVEVLWSAVVIASSRQQKNTGILGPTSCGVLVNGQLHQSASLPGNTTQETGRLSILASATDCPEHTKLLHDARRAYDLCAGKLTKTVLPVEQRSKLVLVALVLGRTVPESLRRIAAGDVRAVSHVSNTQMRVHSKISAALHHFSQPMIAVQEVPCLDGLLAPVDILIKPRPPSNQNGIAHDRSVVVEVDGPHHFYEILDAEDHGAGMPMTFYTGPSVLRHEVLRLHVSPVVHRVRHFAEKADVDSTMDTLRDILSSQQGCEDVQGVNGSGFVPMNMQEHDA